MRCIFIADAHLRRPQDDNYQRLLRFLNGLAGTIDTLYVLGDLFEFWIGYREVPFGHYQPVLAALQQLREAGTAIVYFEGNHDFHMGPFFTETLQATVHPGPAQISLEGRQVFLCHGDEINHRDYSYRLLRYVFHSRMTRYLTLVVPPWVASAIADHMGKKSKARHVRAEQRWDSSALVRDFAAHRFSTGCDVVITGHFHSPFIESGQGKILVSLGDWVSHFSYAEWHDGSIALKQFI